MGFGTDRAGSVRIPSSFCGLFALKPTTDRVSTSGVSLQDRPGMLSFHSTAGPMGRSADDMAMALRVLLNG